MSKLIKFKIRGSGAENDAPTVDDLADQLRDYFAILEAVEQALAEDGQGAIDWRVVHAATASPITFTVEATARQFAVNIDARAGHVITRTFAGIEQLQHGAERPAYFTDQALTLAEHVFERVTNGLDLTDIQSGEGDLLAKITPTVARAATQNIRAILNPVLRPYREIGSVEGRFRKVEQDGFGRHVLWIRSRLTGEEVKCLLVGEAVNQLAQCEIGDIWRRPASEIFIQNVVNGLAVHRDFEKSASDPPQRGLFDPGHENALAQRLLNDARLN